MLFLIVALTLLLVQSTLDSSAPVPITLNGVDVSSAFRPGMTPNTLLGLVTGLSVGKNTLMADAQTWRSGTVCDRRDSTFLQTRYDA